MSKVNFVSLFEPMTVLNAVIFDFDDTLLATRSRRVAALIRAAADFGYHLTSEDIAPHWGKPFNELVTGMASGIDYEAFHRHYGEVMREIHPEVLPGTRKLLALLHDRSVPILVISSGSNSLVRQDLEEAGLWKYISKLWGYEDTSFHKPDPRTLEPVLQTLTQKGISAQQTVYIGDSIADLQVALGNGLLFCAVLTGTSTREDFLKAGLGRALIMSSLEELLEPNSWLQRVLGGD